MRFVLLLCVAVIVAVQSEDACLKNNGKCISEKLCPQGFKIELGECPNNGEICCTATKCQNLGGECISDCPESIIDLGMRSNDCPTNTQCCVWL